MSINIDGIDQQTTHIPSFSFKDKDTDDGLVQVHLTGRMSYVIPPQKYILFVLTVFFVTFNVCFVALEIHGSLHALT